MRPRTLDEVVGQRHLLGEGAPLRTLIERGRLPSMILWGPPGSGKTTIARLLADAVGYRFVSLNATDSGVRAVRALAREAETLLRRGGPQTLLFLDEIHRFSKAQQDALLPPVESGAVVLIGATTENPSFEIIPALRSRARVVVLEALEEQDIATLCERAVRDRERGLGALGITVCRDACAAIYRASAGDARAALTLLEVAAQACLARAKQLEEHGGAPEEASPAEEAAAEPAAPIRLDRAALERALALGGTPAYDKGGEAHFDTISALHKAVRASDPDAALYWLARMLEGGEDPRYVARRLIRAASEDVGLADPHALVQAVAAAQAIERIGLPEGALALAQAAVYLAVAPKSNALYVGYGEAQRDVRQRPPYPVPLELRNAPSRLMKELGYGRGYQYAHDMPDGVGTQPCLPDALRGTRYYRPTERGVEARVRERLAMFERIRSAAAARETAERGGRHEGAGGDR